VVVGRLQQRVWTAEGGSARSVVEVVAEEQLHQALAEIAVLMQRASGAYEANEQQIAASFGK
jgi:single-stranded DNA-binding protein